MTSVALCTYNGEKYIEEQISSILNQSVPVDEIVVCDDGSTDNTLTLIEKFQPHTKTNIRIYRNEHQLGVCANFQKAIDLCEGDIIFLSDQDDVWFQHKVEIICKWFEKNPTKNVVFTDAALIDEKGCIIPNDSLWKRVQFNSGEQFWFNHGFALEIFVRGNVATGATMAFKKNSGPYSLISPNSSVLHDEVLAEAAMNRNSLGYIKFQLISYRLHGQQVCGMPYSPMNRISAVKPAWNTSRLSYLFSYERIKERCEFGQNRLVAKHYWCGIYTILHLREYIHVYGIKCGIIVICNDIYDSYRHSFLRITNKIGRVI